MAAITHKTIIDIAEAQKDPDVYLIALVKMIRDYPEIDYAVVRDTSIEGQIIYTFTKKELDEK